MSRLQPARMRRPASPAACALARPRPGWTGRCRPGG